MKEFKLIPVEQNFRKVDGWCPSTSPSLKYTPSWGKQEWAEIKDSETNSVLILINNVKRLNRREIFRSLDPELAKHCYIEFSY